MAFEQSVDKAFEILNLKLDEYLKDMRPKEVENN